MAERTEEFREGTDEELLKPADENGMTVQEYKYNYGTWISVDKQVYRSWCPKKLYEFKQRDQFKGHHFENGKRIELEIKQLGKPKVFETQFGTSYLITLQDNENRIYKYMGSSNLPELEMGVFAKVKATVKHEEYKGQKETKLQRIKVL